MKKHKVILLPADERILNLYITPNEVEIDDKITSKSLLSDEVQKKWIENLKHVIKILYVLIMIPIPLILYIIITLCAYGVLFVWKGKEKADDWVDWWGDQLELANKYIPFHNQQMQGKWMSESKPSKEKEDIPYFLDRAKKYGYQRVVYISPQEKEKKKRLEELIGQGFIDTVLEYYKEADLYAYIQNKDFLEQYSWIIYMVDEANKPVPAKGNVLYVSRSFLSERAYDSLFYGSFKKCENRIMFSRIRLPYNKLLDESMVLYFETEYNAEVNEYIQKHYHDIQNRLSKNDLRLIYFPAVIKPDEINIQLNDILQYFLPDLFNGDNHVNGSTFQEWVTDLDLQQLYDIIKSYFKIPDGPSPAFIHCVENLSFNNVDKEIKYSYNPIWGNTEIQIHQEVEHYIEYARHPKEFIYYSLATKTLPGEPGYDADNEFFWDGSQLSDEIKNKIIEIKINTGEERLIETLFHIIHEFRDKNPELCSKLCRQLYEEAGHIHRKQSRLYIDKHYRIYLMDYGNIEIELTPLPKTLFFFMLKYPEGIMFKELYKYKQELLYIYGKVGNRTDLEQMQKSISDMTDARSNSVNEKCSRIKEAFLSKISERIASQYFVTGERHVPKKITIDRSYVIFEEPL